MIYSGLVLLFWGFCTPAEGQSPLVNKTAFDVDIYGNAYFLDAAKNTLTLVSKDGSVVREVGGPGWGDGQFDRPAAVWARNGIDVFVADYGNHRIQRFDRGLNFVSSLSTRDSDNPDERFGYPIDVALSRFGELFICDRENTRIAKVNTSSQVELTFGGFGAGKGRLQDPSQLEIGPKDLIYILDGRRVVIFDTFGNYVGDLLEGLFKNPNCLFADETGVMVVDTGTLYCFDQANRPLNPILLAATLKVDPSDIRSIAASGGQLYVLTMTGIYHVPDPRSERSTEKE